MTEQNYLELQQLYDKFAPKGLEILAFPCNNFAGQEPGTEEEIEAFVRSRNVSFPVLPKVDCALSNPLFGFLCEKAPDASLLGIFSRAIKWNFTKFLCDANGVPIRRFGPRENPLSFEAAIEEALSVKVGVILL